MWGECKYGPILSPWKHIFHVVNTIPIVFKVRLNGKEVFNTTVYEYNRIRKGQRWSMIIWILKVFVKWTERGQHNK